MIEPIINYGNLRLLNVPGGKPVYDEVFVEDCYNRNEIPVGATVLDVGGFYGEFGIWCAVEKGCRVRIYEPSLANQIAYFNAMLNKAAVAIEAKAVGRDNGQRNFLYMPIHPAGSGFDEFGMKVQCVTLKSEIDFLKKWFGSQQTFCVKLDCEGAEREIFEDETWLSDVSMVMMEWHNYDGDVYRDILERHGFTVELSDGGPKPRPAWSKNLPRGLLFAKRP